MTGAGAGAVVTSDIISDRLVLVAMSVELMEALLGRDLGSARAMVGYRIPDDWPQAIESMLRFRIAVARESPEALPLLFRAIVLSAQPEVVVGRIGFHGPVDEAGMLEIGYEIFPAFRRRGFAREAVVAMFGWAAQRDSAVRTFRASVRPDNLPSRGLVTGLGFVEVGSQWDEEDGEETIFERAAGEFLPV
jgi:RimJ/RimL family protein N-acetyltransferase